ncbi:MAG: hypothetical protein R6V10_09215 [bacterium]
MEEKPENKLNYKELTPTLHGGRNKEGGKMKKEIIAVVIALLMVGYIIKRPEQTTAALEGIVQLVT